MSKMDPSVASFGRMSHYCARCLARAARRLPRCSGCGTPFSGAGWFDLIEGFPPSREFSLLFAKPTAGPI
jgi:hypothetical protein